MGKRKGGWRTYWERLPMMNRRDGEDRLKKERLGWGTSGTDVEKSKRSEVDLTGGCVATHSLLEREGLSK